MVAVIRHVLTLKADIPAPVMPATDLWMTTRDVKVQDTYMIREYRSLPVIVWEKGFCWLPWNQTIVNWQMNQMQNRIYKWS